MLLQAASEATALSALQGSAAQWLWVVPVLPLLGFVINGVLSLMSATRFGPADPSAALDASHTTSHDAEHGAGAHHDDGGGHHATKHRFATVASIVGPAVVVLSFLLSAVIFWNFKTLAGGTEAPF